MPPQNPKASARITEVIGAIPFRMALAGGWIDQPFVSQFNPSPPGAMVVVSLEPVFNFMDRAGIATSTRRVALEIWNGRLPDREPAELVRELYWAENRNRQNPSGSQDMAGIVYPGISRLEYDFGVEGGIFPARVESCNDPDTVAWLEQTLYILPVYPRPDGYDPLIVRNLVPEWVARLGRTGHECFAAILDRDAAALGAAMTATMDCWKVLLPGNFEHPALTMDLYVVSDEPVPGGFHPKIRAQRSSHD
jgi:hypothetical protein